MVKKIRIYKDKWIPRPTTFKHFSPPSLGDNATVDMLITPSGAWNVELVKNSFCEEDTTTILSIPISRSRAQDSIQWHYDQKGKSQFFDFILDYFSHLKMEDLGFFCVCLWKIWAIRNAAVHGSLPDKAVDVVDWAHFFIDEFHNASPAKSRNPECPTVRNPVWKPPDPSTYKINCDAVINTAGCLVGIGIVIRDWEGFVMASCSQKIDATFSPQVVEATAILRSLQFAIDTGLYPCKVESDAKVVVD
ncbi:hypothetical protein Dsin_030566 [Dipteronia sinensis]|uniref:RNase H type-1 domain-containing protein n=1 Tax=Dipteronia sinensis TaxID=43782 RepID=A0AAD9ZJW2_9ROSI|nr:hypothetical protein Dsin_030566 [Dipteronia sinensis]